MEFFEKLRITAGILCIVVAFLRIILFFVDGAAAIAYSAVFIDWNEAVGLIEGIATAIIAFLFTIVATGFAFIVYIILGAMLIAARRLNFVTIGCNIITGISTILCIRAIAIFADPSINEINIFLIILLIIYLTIFSICLISYIRIRTSEVKIKEVQPIPPISEKKEEKPKEVSNFCKHCGTKLNKEVRSCPQCGKIINKR